MTKHFIVESPHTKAECLKTLDEVNAKGPEYLSKFSWGCMTGNHTGYAEFEAKDEKEARENLPPSVQSKAKVVEVSQFTPQQIKSFHEM